ncbi:cytidine deaminase [Nocardioides sp. CER19]|uniref:cytidine deaminase n=1 Tax=Nocardioides sp. CER19 TaxID=3038538 RepID=UPI00244822CF|nr:cytidine deaminase [Nocardioides sp. CER19]MDH2415510.1 cytidine deaminase [Nocardioides sp. CER19]
MTDLSAEDGKLVTLARATRARTGAAEGAAVRDQDGRTYAGATVSLPSLSVSAVGVCVAMAVSSGSTGLQAVVVLGDSTVSDADLAVVRDFGGSGVTVHSGDARGDIATTTLS